MHGATPLHTAVQSDISTSTVGLLRTLVLKARGDFQSDAAIQSDSDGVFATVKHLLDYGAI
jgi:hypothetical protein